MADTLWCGKQADKPSLFLQSGQFSSTIKTSIDISAVDTTPQGIGWDDVDTTWGGVEADKLYRNSGQFTSTIKDSESVVALESDLFGVSTDNLNTPYTGRGNDKLRLQSGKFTSTLKTSLDVNAINISPQGISFDATNTPWCGGGGGETKLFLQSGQFTSTLKTSTADLGGDTTNGVSYDGTNTPWIANGTPEKMFLTSGQFTSTIKTSLDISAVDNLPTGIDHGDFAARVPPPPSGDLVFKYHRLAAGGQPAHPTDLLGRTKRYPPLHHVLTILPPPGGVPHKGLLQRFIPSQPPYPSQLLGLVRRYPPLHHKFTAVPIPRLPILSRVIRGPYPPIDALTGRSKRAHARPPSWIEFQQTYREGFRVADASLALFELFVGEDTPPDFGATGQPVATSPTLPFSFTPTPPGTGGKLLYIVVRETNEYGLTSFNTQPTLKLIDSGGAELLQDPSPPQDVVIQDGATGFLRVLASYFPKDDSSPADTWEIYVTEGSDPVPGVDVPAFTGLMIVLGDEAGISQTVGPFTPGTTAHVIVTALRAAGPARGNATVVLKVLALPLDITDGQMFGGNVYEQR